MSVVSGLVQSQSADKASSRQQSSADKSTRLQYDMWREQVEMFQPFLDAGNFGVKNLQDLMKNSSERAAMSTRAWEMQNFQLSKAPPANFSVNPITGQVEYSPQIDQGTPSTQYEARTPNQYDSGSVGYQAPPWEGGRPSTGGIVEDQGRPSGGTIFRTMGDDGPAELPVNRSNLYTPSNQDGQPRQAIPGAPSQQPNLSQGGAIMPDLPTLPGQVDFEFDKDDPVYQFKKEQLNEQVERKLASLGMSDSRAGVDAVAEANMGLISDETDKQYARLEGERNYLASRDANLFGMGMQRGNTLYDRIYGQQSDLYNRMYGQNLSEDSRRLGLTQDQYNMAASQYGTGYQGYLDLTKIGTHASGSAGQGALATGQGMSNSMMQGANAAAQNSLMQGRIWSDQIGGVRDVLMNQNWGQNNTGQNNWSSPNTYSGGGAFNSYVKNPSNYSSGSIL